MKKLLKNKKAQMEAFGLVFIVLLISLGVFFMISSSFKNQKKVAELNPQNMDLAQITIDAVKSIKLDCTTSYTTRRLPLDELIQDVATEDNRLYCNGYSSNTYLNGVFTNILNSTLRVWQKPYYMTLEKNGEILIGPIINPDFPDCDATNPIKGGDSGIQPFPLKNRGGSADLKLFICN